MSSNFPFGFTPPDPDDDGKNESQGFDMSQLGSALENIGRMMQGGQTSGPINWDLAHQVARQQEAQKQDFPVSAESEEAVRGAIQLADLWLSEAETFPAKSTATGAWSRGEWIDETLPAWRNIIDPVAGQVESVLGNLIGGPEALSGLTDMPGLELPPGFDAAQLNEMLGPITNMARQLGASMFGQQVGQALGGLSGEVLCGSDVGFPLTDDVMPILIPINIKKLADDLNIEQRDVLVYIALRESAHQRLFSHVPWLREYVIDAVTTYASGIRVDTSAIEDAVSGIDPSNPESMQAVLSGGIFTPTDTPAQQQALANLETILALVEGYVDHVVNQAVAGRLPTLDQLNEAMRRRRATGGPAEKTFANLVGLQLRPRRLREAKDFWQRIEQDRGISGRDDLWNDRDRLPSPADLDDPDRFWQREAEVAALAADLESIEDVTSLLAQEESSDEDPPEEEPK